MTNWAGWNVTGPNRLPGLMTSLPALGVDRIFWRCWLFLTKWPVGTRRCQSTDNISYHRIVLDSVMSFMTETWTVIFHCNSFSAEIICQLLQTTSTVRLYYDTRITSANMMFSRHNIYQVYYLLYLLTRHIQSGWDMGAQASALYLN